MTMKSITAFALASLVFAGTACSQAADPDAAELQTVSADEGAGGTFNLSLPSPTAESAESSGSFNLNLGVNDDQRLIGSGAFGSADFGSDPSVNLNIDLDEEADLLATTTPSPAEPEDDVIRLTPKK
jgi:outer membrane lipoprotein-sorting protein